jgi:hypothetical protein
MWKARRHTAQVGVGEGSGLPRACPILGSCSTYARDVGEGPKGPDRPWRKEIGKIMLSEERNVGLPHISKGTYSEAPQLLHLQTQAPSLA